MELLERGRRYSGYDEYEGIFGALGVHAASRATSRPPTRRSGRSTARFGDATRGFPTSRRSGTSLSTNGFDRRDRYLSSRASKRRLKPIGDDELDEDEVEETGVANPAATAQQIWLPTKNFTFRQRAGKLDTRTLARLDLQKIVATTDVESIQRHLENLAFSDVTLDDVQQYSDAYFLKLFQIAQLTLEYLMNVQDSLATHCESLESQCEGLAEECQSLEAENHKIEGEVVALKKEIRQKQSTLATFEVMLLNATAAKRAQRGLEQLSDQENDPAARNILGASIETGQDDEAGAVPLVSSCVLCGKKFISPEYLVRHQHKKHSADGKSTKKKTKKKNKESDGSGSESSCSGSENGNSKRKRREPKTAPLPAEVLQALHDRNELSKQLVELQTQLHKEKEQRAEDAKLAEQQQMQLGTQLTSYMTKLQATLLEMEKKHEQSKHEMMRYTEETLERVKSDRGTKIKSHAGRLESDEDDSAADRKQSQKAASPEEVERRILDSLLRAQAEIHHKNSELEQANRKLQTKLRRRARQAQFDAPPPTTLLSMTAMDAQRYGIDTGLMEEEKPPAKIKSAPILDDKPVQTDDEERKKTPRKKQSMQTREVQTEAIPVEIVPNPVPKPDLKREPRALTKKMESNIPKPAVVNFPSPEPKTQAASEEEIEPSLAEDPKPPSPQPLPKVDPPLQEKPESNLQHAAHLVGKVALGFLARKTLRSPSNWQLSIPQAALSRALSETELENLIECQGGTLQDVVVEIEDDMTANDLRVEFAEALSGHPDETSPVAIDYHRVLLHHRSSGQEISGDQFIYHLRSQLQVEIIPHFEAAEAHVDQLLDLHEETSTQLHAIRRASMVFASGELPLALQGRTDADAVATRAATHIQSIARRFLAIRTVEMIKIDRLVEARLLSLRLTTSSPRNRALSASRSQRRVTRSASVAAIREETADERVVVDKAQQIHDRLADLVKQKTGIETRTKSTKWSRGRMSTEEYARHVETLDDKRKEMATDVQQRISEISERLHKLVEETYDPMAAKQAEDQYLAATKIQLAVQVAIARRKLQQLLGKKEDATVKNESDVSIEKEKESFSDESENDGTSDQEEKTDRQEDEKPNEMDVEELDEMEVKRLADAYEQAAELNEPAPPAVAANVIAEVKPKPKPRSEPRRDPPRRAGTPPPHRQDLLGRSPRPKEETHLISPFSKTPLLSRRPAVTRRGSGYDNAR